MGAELAGTKPGDTVAVWGAGGVGQMAARAAMLPGAEQVHVIDRLPERLEQGPQHAGAEGIDLSTTDVMAAPRERTGRARPGVVTGAGGDAAGRRAGPRHRPAARAARAGPAARGRRGHRLLDHRRHGRAA